MASGTENSKGKSKRTWLFLGAAFAVFWGAILFFFGGDLITSEYLEDSLPPVPTADYSWKLKVLQEKPVELSQYKGKTIFMYIWATNCGPCVKEMPSIAKLASDPRLRDVAFLCIAGDESAEPVKAFLQGKNWPMTMLRAEDAPEVFRTEGIPATFVIGADGSIVASTVGAREWDDPKVVEMLVQMVAAKPPTSAPNPGSPTKDEPKAE